SFHRVWAQPGVTRYFVANTELALALRSAAPSAHIDVSGIPISDRFGNAPSRTVARDAIGIDREKPVALVVGGGLGLRVSETTRALASARVADLQIVAVCGRNEAALNDLRA